MTFEKLKIANDTQKKLSLVKILQAMANSPIPIVISQLGSKEQILLTDISTIMDDTIKYYINLVAENESETILKYFEEL